VKRVSEIKPAGAWDERAAIDRVVLDAGDRKLEGFRDLPADPEDFLHSEKAQSQAAKLLNGFQTGNR